tara:strand:- start:514 stop:675 length:162 start_codon:yes stop_codon:yes gene_type:complete
MKIFRVEKKHNLDRLVITLYDPPYENENILNKTGWKIDEVTITDITPVEDINE